MINKHAPNKGKMLYESYVNKQKYAGVKLEYFIDKYGEEHGRAEYLRVNSEKGLTYKNFIRKYHADGERKFKEYINNRYNGYSSAIANKFFDRLIEYMNICSELVYYNGTNEFALMSKDKSYYFYDFKIKGSNKIIEFHGNYWHANPSIYSPDEIISFPNKNVIAMDLWEKDIQKCIVL